MDNTVGSQKNLTSTQKAVLIGTLLGDGILELNYKHPRLRIDHSTKQERYFQWKYKIFHKIANKKRCLSVLDKRRKKLYHHFRFDTITTPL